ncbi:MAG: SIMPL domain-containing protein [Chloroflexota bacterium]|nr:SIMPL domain-containing protein [Chloroflexota bacterium]
MEVAFTGIQVHGTGYMEAPPDIAYLDLGFTSERQDLARAREEAADAMGSVLDTVRALGVPAADIRTIGFDVWRDADRKLFVVSNSARITIRKLELAGTVLDAAIAAGANDVRGLHFGLEDREALERQARELAVRNAKEKAADLARLTGVELGPAVYGRETESHGGFGAEMAMARNLALDTDTPIERGQTRVSARVEVRYSIF